MPPRHAHSAALRPRATTPRDRALAECSAGARAIAMGQMEAGLRRCAAAVTIAPQDADVAAVHGVALRSAGKLQDAQRELIRAITLDRQRADSYLQLGHTFFMVKDYAQASNALLAAATLKDTDASTWRDAAEAMRLSHRPIDGLAAARRAYALDDRNSAITNTLALLLHRTGAVDEALELCDQRRRTLPDDRNLDLTHAMLLRTCGRHVDGWALHERRLELPELTQRANSPAYPRWDGSALHGAHLLVRGEQGLGDQVQFVRWATRLRAAGAARVTVQCATPLVRLLQTFADADEVIAMDTVAPAHDLHVDIMSLPHLLQTGGDMLGELVPYLRAPVVNAGLAARLEGTPRMGRMRLGLVWGGTPKHTEDRSRSMPLATLLPVLQRTDVTDRGCCSRDHRAKQLDALPVALRAGMVDVATDCTDMADTAQVLTTCDALLSVDTSVAHVAGALGVPTWVMVAHPAEWRWGRTGTDSAYYPHATVLRQRLGGDWSAVVEGAMQAIDHWHRTRG